MLKTSCKSCVFSKDFNYEACKIAKPVLFGSSAQFVEGFCRHKRTVDNPYQLEHDLVRKINKEERKLSVIIVAKTVNNKKLMRTIDSLKPYRKFISQVIISTINAGDRKTAFNMMINNLNSTQFHWILDDIKIDPEDVELIEERSMVEYSCKNVKSHWFLGIRQGEELDHAYIHCFSIRLSNINDNFVCLYKSINDPIDIIANTTAFKEMDGNYEMPWIEKLKTFDNWEKVCHKIE